MTTTAPDAAVVAQWGRTVTVRCPYCGAQHVHMVDRRGAREHRAPGCGLVRSTAQRLAGYVFTTGRDTR